MFLFYPIMYSFCPLMPLIQWRLKGGGAKGALPPLSISGGGNAPPLSIQENIYEIHNVSVLSSQIPVLLYFSFSYVWLNLMIIINNASTTTFDRVKPNGKGNWRTSMKIENARTVLKTIIHMIHAATLAVRRPVRNSREPRFWIPSFFPEKWIFSWIYHVI